jgi:microcin C transport system permease protein
MFVYTIRRLFLIIPTILGIMAISFLIIQFAPGGPIERIISQIDGNDNSALSRVSGGFNGDFTQSGQSADINNKYRGSQGLDPEFILELEKQFGFDKPPLERFYLMITNYIRFDFGESYYRDIRVIDLIIEKLPVSVSLGLWMTLISYLISIPLGMMKAVRDGTKFDLWTSTIIVISYALPGFLIAIFLIIFFAGGSYLDWFPLRGLTSDNFNELSILGKVIDYIWHITLPLLSMVLAAFATTTLLTKNSFLDEIGKQYVLTARAKGLTEKQVLKRHVFRNAMLIIVSGFPAAFISAFFTGSLLIETIFSLDGLGLLSFESIVNRDYAVVFASLYIFSFIGLIINLISDLIYHWIDPRIDFEKRDL